MGGGLWGRHGGKGAVSEGIVGVQCNYAMTSQSVNQRTLSYKQNTSKMRSTDRPTLHASETDPSINPIMSGVYRHLFIVIYISFELEAAVISSFQKSQSR